MALRPVFWALEPLVPNDFAGQMLAAHYQIGDDDVRSAKRVLITSIYRLEFLHDLVFVI